VFLYLLLGCCVVSPSSVYGNRIGGVMAGVLDSSVVDHGFEPRSGQTKDYRIGICCLCAKHAAVRRKSKDLLAQDQDNVSELGRHLYLRVAVSVS